jgi:hypothetical protein
MMAGSGCRASVPHPITSDPYREVSIVQALLAQAPQFDYYTVLVPAGPLGIIGSLSGLVTLVCFILVVIKMFQRGQVGLGVVSIITAFCFIGFLNRVVAQLNATPVASRS